MDDEASGYAHGMNVAGIVHDPGQVGQSVARTVGDGTDGGERHASPGTCPRRSRAFHIDSETHERGAQSGVGH